MLPNISQDTEWYCEIEMKKMFECLNVNEMDLELLMMIIIIVVDHTLL